MGRKRIRCCRNHQCDLVFGPAAGVQIVSMAVTIPEPPSPLPYGWTMSVALHPSVLADLTEACGESPGQVCEWVFDATGSNFWSNAADWAIERPLRILIVVLVAMVVSRLVGRTIDSFVKRIVEEDAAPASRLQRSGAGRYLRSDRGGVRRSERANTIGSVLRSLATAIIWGFAMLTVLGELSINLGPLIAGAGIAGVAIGFGAQTIVRDFLTGLFMLVEDQFGVGDIIDAGEVTGTVEKVSLRTTTLRDVSGTVWHIPNGEMTRVANKSQLWARALLDVEVAYDCDLRFAEGVIQQVANDMFADPEWGGDEIMEAPEVWGVQNLGADGVAIRLVVKTKPSTQWAVERELRLRLKEALDEAGIEIPYPQRTVWIRNQGEFPAGESPDPASIRTTTPDRHIAAGLAGVEAGDD